MADNETHDSTIPADDTAPRTADASFGEPTTYVRPEDQRPAGPNPFDNGTAEPAPPLGQPNGVPLEEVLAVTPPEVYERPSGPVDAVTAKASDEERLRHDQAVVEAERAEADRLEQAATLATPAGQAAASAPPASSVPATPSAVPDSAREDGGTSGEVNA